MLTDPLDFCCEKVTERLGQVAAGNVGWQRSCLGLPQQLVSHREEAGGTVRDLGCIELLLCLSNNVLCFCPLSDVQLPVNGESCRSPTSLAPPPLAPCPPDLVRQSGS